MKIYGLTAGLLLTALVIGLLLGIVFTAATAPHPVEVPVQVITPVPTPPPVVITQPTPVPVQTSQPSSSCNGSGGFPWWLTLLIFGIPMVIMVVFLFCFNGGEGGLVMAVIGFVVLAMTFMIAPMILDAIVCALPVIP